MKAIDQRLAHFREDRLLTLIVGLSILGVVLVLVRTFPHGPGVSPDSAMYVSVAVNLVDREALLDAVPTPPRRRIYTIVREYGRLGNLPLMFNLYGDPLIYWAPLFPTILAAGGLSISDPLEVGRVLNAFAFGVTILAVGLCLRSRRCADPLVVIGCAATLVSLPLLHVASWLWSESLFIMFATLSIAGMATYFGGGSSATMSSLIWAAVFAALACLTRYIGVTIIMSTAVLLLYRRDAFSSANLKDSCIYMLISATPITLWVARNYVGSRTLFGSRIPYESEFPLFEHVRVLLNTLSSWMPTLDAGSRDALLELIGVLAIAAAALSLVVAVRSRDGRHTSTIGEGSSSPWPSFTSIAPFAVFTAVYLALLLIFKTFFQIDPLGSRLLSPIYVPLLITLTITVDWALRLDYRWDIIAAGRSHVARGITRGAVGLVGLVVIGGFIMGGLSYAYNDTLNNRGGLGYASERWRSSELMAHIKTNPGTDGLIYTNARDGVYIHTRLQGNVRRPPRQKSDLADLADHLSGLDRAVYVVWFHNANTHGFDYGPEEIELALDVEPVAEFADGVMYRLRRDRS